VERTFHLESVLEFRQLLEDEARQILGRRQRELWEEQERLKALHREQECVQDDIARRAAEPSVDVAVIGQGYAYRDVLETRIAGQVERVRLAAEEVERQREAVVAAMQDRKVMEKLKERHVADYAAWANQVESSVLDDVALARYRRNRTK
jgi:flagellar FliJ protein